MIALREKDERPGVRRLELAIAIQELNPLYSSLHHMIAEVISLTEPKSVRNSRVCPLTRRNARTVIDVMLCACEDDHAEGWSTGLQHAAALHQSF